MNWFQSNSGYKCQLHLLTNCHLSCKQKELGSRVSENSNLGCFFLLLEHYHSFTIITQFRRVMNLHPPMTPATTLNWWSLNLKTSQSCTTFPTSLRSKFGVIIWQQHQLHKEFVNEISNFLPQCGTCGNF